MMNNSLNLSSPVNSNEGPIYHKVKIGDLCVAVLDEGLIQYSENRGNLQDKLNKSKITNMQNNFNLNALGIITVAMRNGKFTVVDGNHRIETIVGLFGSKDSELLLNEEVLISVVHPDNFVSTYEKLNNSSKHTSEQKILCKDTNMGAITHKVLEAAGLPHDKYPVIQPLVVFDAICAVHNDAASSISDYYSSRAPSLKGFESGELSEKNFRKIEINFVASAVTHLFGLMRRIFDIATDKDPIVTMVGQKGFQTAVILDYISNGKVFEGYFTNTDTEKLAAFIARSGTFSELDAAFKDVARRKRKAGNVGVTGVLNVMHNMKRG